MADIYAGVIIPRPLDNTFTYRVPGHLTDAVAIGSRVIVPFGPKRFLTGVVESLSPLRPADVAAVKDIDSVLDSGPIVVHPQIRFWRWISSYYMCTVGDVFKAALPGGLIVESETVVEPEENPDTAALASLSKHDMDILALLRERGRMSIRDLNRNLGTADSEKRVAALVQAGVVNIHESLVNRYRRVKVQKVTITLQRGDSEALRAAFAAVRRSQGQQSALMSLIALSGFNRVTHPLHQVSRSELLDSAPGITWEHVQALVRKGLAVISVREVSRFSADDECSGEYSCPLPVLSQPQADALKAIHAGFRDHNVSLLHGVTSSGKTEIYIHLISYALSQGRQVLYLVPEIALTTQLTRRLQRVFGKKVRIYHSKFSDNQRCDIWRDMLADKEPCVVIGARSAVFLPFRSLGLVIVDEEHDASYKQSDPAPRYNGRDAAIVLASYHGAKTLLGSATPSVETFWKANEGKYGLVTLDKRYGDASLPEVEIVDMAREYKRRAVSGSLSEITIATARECLENDRQVIFFHNRRGYSPRARCRMCQFTPKCDFCDVSLTYHKRTNTLECHYCGATYPVPKVCPACHEPAIEIEGYGTERIEDSVGEAFPGIRTLRMDLDTTRSKDAYADIIDAFSKGNARILVGTQMVTKGLDFDSVGLVTVVNADAVINFPDFRSSERAFNMLEQVAGRAGRRGDKPGEVLIQTYTPSHPVISFVRAHDYAGFYAWELEQRRKYHYPPFARIVDIYIKHRERGAADSIARDYATRLRALLGNRVSGPVEPAVERVASFYIRKVMLRIEHGASLAKVKEILRNIYVEMNGAPVKTGAMFYYDVDPV